MEVHFVIVVGRLLILSSVVDRLLSFVVCCRLYSSFYYL